MGLRRRWNRIRSGNKECVVPASPQSSLTVEQVYHDAALQFLTVQISTNDVLDSRNYQAFTIGSTVLPLTFALLNLSEQEVPDTANWSLAGALVFYLLLLACACRASFVRGLEYRPDIATLRAYLDDYETNPKGGLHCRSGPQTNICPPSSRTSASSSRRPDGWVE